MGSESGLNDEPPSGIPSSSYGQVTGTPQFERLCEPIRRYKGFDESPLVEVLERRNVKQPARHSRRCFDTQSDNGKDLHDLLALISGTLGYRIIIYMYIEGIGLYRLYVYVKMSTAGAT